MGEKRTKCLGSRAQHSTTKTDLEVGQIPESIVVHITRGVPLWIWELQIEAIITDTGKKSFRIAILSDVINESVKDYELEYLNYS